MPPHPPTQPTSQPTPYPSPKLTPRPTPRPTLRPTPHPTPLYLPQRAARHLGPSGWYVEGASLRGTPPPSSSPKLKMKEESLY